MSSYNGPPDHGQQGAVLVVVLWIVLALSLLGMSFSGAIRTEVHAARNVIDQKQAYYIARAGIEYTVYKILESQSAFRRTQQRNEGELYQPTVIDLGTVGLELPDGAVQVEIIDERGKINLNSPLALGNNSTYFSDLIYNLLIGVGVDPVEADGITDAILDWRDRDNFARPNGAEDEYYLSLDPPYRCKNDDFSAPDELLLVRGITPEMFYGRKGLSASGERVEYYGLQKYFTTFAAGGIGGELKSAPLAVLAARPDLDYEIATRIFELRRPGQNAEQLLQDIPGLPTDVAVQLTRPGVSRSPIYTLVSRGSLAHSRVVSRIRCVVELNPRSSRGYEILYWNESDTEI